MSSVPVLQELSAQLKHDTTRQGAHLPAFIQTVTTLGLTTPHFTTSRFQANLFLQHSDGLYLTVLFLGLFNNAFSTT
jgi:hypothetical protein